MAFTVIVLFTTLRLPESKDQSSPHAAKRIEFPSAALLLLAVGAPLFAINLGGQVFPWSHPLVIVLLSITPLFVAGFYYVDTRIAITPIVPRRFIFNRNVAIALACTLPMKFVFDQVGTQLRASRVAEVDRTQLRYSFGTYVAVRPFTNPTGFSDWALTCFYLGGPLGTVFAGLLVNRYRRFKPFLQLNILADIVIYACFSAGWIKPEKPVYAPILVFTGACEGVSEGLWLVALLSLVDDKDQPLLYAFFDLALSIAGDLGIAISLATEGSLVKSRLASGLSGTLNADEIIRRSLEDLEYIRQLPPKVQTVILEAFTSSVEVAFGTLSLLLGRQRSNGHRHIVPGASG
ncbi:hypothetical protein LTR91_019700 [Friedmanniomyces endolithicus]|uniref:Uncharacterized protein n=1 Tax=Friedmanniomyces endolithicus TaxID=329885 RepID=A0AAN6HA82_9PEZI|nr:hypothetical protein LTR75_012801 [Friedmanniomyces endolithicus]KAK0844845.1 hypothetical protein LTR03_007840 [Friedmanniomyces endolithicus]KAK0846841.1 hypothetical protein LTS02_014735 [Friedmanniomyces endolithicus]KAK0871224.1 hypothetical protein LTR87_012970 [Friedmanniomyces endolithicus]KAK0896303.1 hypothetical protein LTR02_011312 [Friedmanniomyces endolithicus]